MIHPIPSIIQIKLTINPSYEHHNIEEPAIILGGARQMLAHMPEIIFPNDEMDKQFPGVPEFFRSWAKSDVKGWEGEAELARDVNDGGCWTGSKCPLWRMEQAKWVLMKCDS